ETGNDADLCILAAQAKAWPRLRELVVLDPDGEQGTPERFVNVMNRAAGRPLGRYERGYPELFPFAPGYRDAFPGKLPDARTAMAALDFTDKAGRDARPAGLVVITFDADGQQTDEVIRVPLSPALQKIPRHESYLHDDDYLQHLIEQTGFSPAFIRVQDYAFP